MSTPYRVVPQEFDNWQQKVISMALSTPPVSPVNGDRYVVKPTGTGAWASHDNEVAYYNGAWVFDGKQTGWTLYNSADGFSYQWNGTAWVIFGLGDMKKSVYDTDNNGIVDRAASVDDGGANVTTAAQVKESYDKRGNFNSSLNAIIFNL